MQEQVGPLPPTEDTQEGTAAHWVARRYLAGYGHELPVGAKFYSEGREWVVDSDMHTGAQMYVRAMGGPHPDLKIEEFVEVERVHHEECAGTPDGLRYYPDAREAYTEGWHPEEFPTDAFNAGLVRLLRVGDYKYGHRYVEVFENPQLSAYAAGVIESQALREDDQLLYVDLTLVQPRSYHRDGPVRHWITRATNLRTVINDANEAVDRALMPLGESFAPEATPGEHCIDCAARHVCRGLQADAMRILDYSHSAERVELPAWAIGVELALVQSAVKRLEARESGLAAQAEALLRAGHSVPFYAMQPGQSKLTYFLDVNTDELVGLGELLGIDLRKKLERKDIVVTPTQAIALGIDPVVMKAYAHRPAGAQKLTRETSITARKVFSK